MHRLTLVPLALAGVLVLPLAARQQQDQPGFQEATGSLAHQLDASLRELDLLREKIVAEQLPLSRRLTELEGELSGVRAEYQQVSRELDGRTVELSRLAGEIKAAQDESAYLSSLLGEYVRNFETRLHIAEVARYTPAIEAARLAPERVDAPPEEVYRDQAALVAAALDRLHEALGGARFDGRAVDASRMVKDGTFVLVGPAALFRSADGVEVGTVEQRLGSPEPSVVAFETPEDRQAAERLVLSSAGLFPLDPTLGDAHKIESTEDTLVEHMRKGGPVMVPILGMAGAALLVVLVKWVGMLFVRRPSRARLAALLGAIARGDRQGARDEAERMRGPGGKMLREATLHLGEPRELLEEIMYERVLSTRLRLQRWLPFVAISASSAPLLGLLGTVTGIMNTFTLITVFGTGDVKTLSSGISEALITTEFGLIVAIPSLLLHAFLSRKAKSVVDDMEKSALALLNQVGKTPMEAPVELAPLGPSSLAAGKAELAAASH